jgi:hypothetical protein
MHAERTMAIRRGRAILDRLRDTVPGALSQGRPREEARENVIDALRLMLTPDDGDPSVMDERTEPLDLTMVA